MAESGDTLIAAVVGRSDLEYNRHYHAHRGYLGPAATLPAHRGKGLAEALTAQAMNVLFERGIHTVCLHTWETNKPALGAIRDLGFRAGHEWKVLRKTIH
ncbi:MAG: GNAT family N-acetyltransferase [Dehalococcoidia bacterium]|nr:GNAT family N-acetyltransferase [Dehalococcoidia bacterium]